jgi:hypothetical protein
MGPVSRTTTQIIDELAALRHPVPAELNTGVDMPVPTDIALLRHEYATLLAASADAGREHPVLIALRDAADRLTSTDWHVKMLLGYARAVSDNDDEPDAVAWSQVVAVARRLGVPDPERPDPQAQAAAKDAIAGLPRRRWPAGMRSLEVQRLHTVLVELGVGTPPQELLGVDPDGEYRWWIAQSRRLERTDSRLASRVAAAAADWLRALLEFAYPRAENYRRASGTLTVMARDLVHISTGGRHVGQERDLLDTVIAELTRVRAALGEVDTDG